MYKHIFAVIILLLMAFNITAQEEVIVNVNKTDKENKSKVFVNVDQNPEFPDGKSGLISFYKKNSILEICNNGENCKTLYYQVVIDTLGNAGEYKLLRGINEKYNNETKRLISLMPKWKPGKKGDKLVKVLVTLDIKYKAIE